MRKAFIILMGILFTLLFATCKQFTTDIDGYLSYWSSEAYITDSSIKAVLQNDLNSIPSVSSAEDVSVTFKLKNPKSFSLDLPPAAAPAKKVVVFEHLTQDPVAGTDYTLTQSEDRQSLTLTYKASFLKAHEWGAQDLSSTLSLYAVDGRLFKQTYTLKLKANTPPQNPSFTVAKTTGLPAYYVLCIKVPDMDKRVPGGLLHKDLARIEVNGTPYTFSVNEAQTAFTKPEADVFITHSAVEKLNEPDADVVPPDSSWVLYYKTDVEVKDGAAKKDYTIKLIDEKGLASGIVNASTKPNKPTAEVLTVTKGSKASGSGAESDPVIIGSDSTGAELMISSATGGTTVHCTVSEIGGSTPVKYDGNPATVPLPLNGAGEKKYKLEYYTDGEGFAATPVKTIYYKVVQGHTVSFDANGGAYPDSSTVVSKAALHGTTISQPDPRPKKQGFGVTGWYKDKACSAGQAWNFATDMVTDDMTLYAQWTAGADTPYKVEHYQQNVNDNNYPAAPTDTDDNATGTTGANAAVTLKNYPGFETGTYTAATIAADGSTVVKVYYTRKQITVTFKLDGGNIGGDPSNVIKTGKYGATLSAPAEATLKRTGYTFNSWKPEGSAPALTLTFPAADATYTAQWTANTYYVRFDKNDDAAAGNMDDQQFTYDAPTKALTKNQFIKSGHDFDGWAVSADGPKYYIDEAQVTNLATAQDAIVRLYAKWKKKTYTVRFSVADGVGELKGEYNDGTSHSNTAQNGGGEVKLENVPYGTQVTFTATPTTSAGAWKVAGWTKNNAAVNGTNGTYTLSNVTADTAVTVKFYQSEIDGTDPMAWRALLNAVSDAPENATIKINGEIKATIANDNKGEIVINKNLTIKGKTGAGSDKLNAITQSRIFKVKTGKTLTLENITLKNGGKYPATEDGGGIYSEGTLTLKNTTIESCGATNGGGVYVSGGTFEMHGSSAITGCTAVNSGGGVYVGGGTFEMHDSSKITDCTANEKGGGVYVSSGTFKMQDSAIVTPSTGPDQYTAGKNDVYLESEKKITVEGTLTGTAPVARITPREYTAGHLYLTGSGVGTHHLKFTVPPEKVTEDSENWNVFWYVDAGGTLKAEVEDPVMLKTVINDSPNNTIIKLGNISDLQTVEIWGYKKIMLKADRAVTLTCPKKDQNDYKHLQVQRNASLILKGSITLQGADYGGNTQYALFVENGGKAEIKDGVTITGFKNGNIGPVVSDGNLTMSGGEISGNKAKNGGGVYIHATWRHFTMTGGTIKGNTADKGGGVYVNGSLNGGYPIRGQFLMKGGTITGNTAETNGKAVFVYYADFKWESGQITANTGSGAAVATDLSGNFNNSTNPHQEPS